MKLHKEFFLNVWDSPVGSINVVTDDEKLFAITFDENHKSILKSIGIRKTREKMTAPARETIFQLKEYFAKKRKKFDLPIAVHGTHFQEGVWKELRRIPYGTKISYTDQAEALKMPLAVRAIASANGRNPLCIVIPCHRVISKSGGLGGYSGGLAVKENLLKLEATNR